METTSPPKKSQLTFLWAALFCILAIVLTVIARRSLKVGEEAAITSEGLALEQAPPPDAPAEEQQAYVSRFEKEAQRRQNVAQGVLAGLVPEKSGFLHAPGTEPSTSSSGQQQAAKKVASSSWYTPEQERELIRRLDPAIQAEQRRLYRMTSKYKRQYKVVKEVDDYFMSMPRYRALYRKYNQDRNLFSFFRGAVSLPEVRQGVKKYIFNADAMRVGMMMLAEGLGQPVPKPVMKETMNFINEDHDMALYMGSEFWPNFTRQMPAAIATANIPPDRQAALENFTNDLSGPSTR